MKVYIILIGGKYPEYKFQPVFIPVLSGDKRVNLYYPYVSFCLDTGTFSDYNINEGSVFIAN